MEWKKKIRKIKGFTFLELVIVLAVIGIIVIIALPNVIKYYYQQRFYQEVQHLVALFRTAQFTSISTNHWIGIAMHPNCPYILNSIDFCIQILRLPQGRCSLSESGSANENWPTDWQQIPICTDENTNQLCEYRDERWLMDKITRPLLQAPFDKDTIYIIGPDGTVTSQNKGEDNRICSSLPIPVPTLQLIFAYPPADSPALEHYYKGVCISGRGNIYSTGVAKNYTELKCSI